NQMRRTSLFAVAAAALIATGFGVWASSTTARVSTGTAAAALIAVTGFGTSSTTAHVPSTGPGIEPFQIMKNTEGLPTVELADYTFVFPHWFFCWRRLHPAQTRSPGPPLPVSVGRGSLFSRPKLFLVPHMPPWPSFAAAPRR